MLTAARLRACVAGGGVAAIFRELGYPVEPVPLVPDEWRRAGIDVPWSGEADFQLMARLRRFDLFFLSTDGPRGEEGIARFLRSYREYNVLTKSSIVFKTQNTDIISIYDLSDRKALRRLDVALDSPSPHALDRLNLLTLADSTPLPRAFDLALDRESVTKRFFERFRTAVDAVAAALRGIAGETAESGRSQALLILSRLLFLSFIQEKGWLNGERRFLFDRLERCEKWGDEFFSVVLRPLFFGCLNAPLGERNAAARKLGRIPYLNGGLFEPSPFERRHPELHLPNELMQRVIVGVFEKFDFSSDEGDAAGTHVDPEMLGRVFESLMAAEERAVTGSFYTPRQIVDVMTERAIVEWLAEGDAALRHALASEEPRCNGAAARALLERLASIAILDPACGSGAFLLSSLSVVERLTVALSACAGTDVDPHLRQSIVERSLFGVDLKPEAVRLCELRLWLSIVSTGGVDAGTVRALPNLDRNILQGNSLFSPTDFLGNGRGDIYREWVYALRAQADLISRYRNAAKHERPAVARLVRDNDRRLASDLLTRALEADEGELQRLATPQRDLFGRARPMDRERCLELQARIAENRRSLERLEDGVLDFFSYDVHFAQVMARGGFDVIAGNPPWVRNARIDKQTKQMVSDRYSLFRESSGRGFHQPDLAVAFFERAMSLACDGGTVALLMPAKIANAGYATRLRSAAGRFRIIALDDWSAAPERHFEADTFPLGITVSKSVASERHRVTIRGDGEAHEIAQHELSVDGAGSEWLTVPADVAAILRRLRHEYRPLVESLGRPPVMGVKTGENRAFFLGEVRITRRGAAVGDVVIPLDSICRCARGRDLARWRLRDSVWMLWPPPDGFRNDLEWPRRFAESRGVNPDSLRLSYVRPEHVGIKVAWKDVSRGMSAVVLPESADVEGHAFPLVPNQTLYSLDAVSLDEAHAMAAVLNSVVADALLLSTAERAKDAHFRYFGRTVGQMPLPRMAPDIALWDSLVRLARRAHRGGAVQGDVDEAVAKLYGVSDGELAVLRRFVAIRLARDAG